MFFWRTCSKSFFVCAAMLLAGLSSAHCADDAATPAPPDGPKYTLRYKFQPGENIRSQIWHRVNLETTISGSTQTAETTSGSVKNWRITAADPNGQISFEHSVESVDLRQKLSDHQEITYNSQTDKKPPPAYASVPQSLRVPLAVITMDPSGKILKRVDKRGAPPADAQNNQMVIPLPPDPVAIGESWNMPAEITISLQDGGNKVINTRQHYTLEKVIHGVASITVATQVLTPVNNPKIESQLIQRLTKGTVRFDMEAGRVLSQKLDLDERVLGFNGDDSSLHYLGSFTEEYLPPPPKTAAASKPKKAK